MNFISYTVIHNRFGFLENLDNLSHSAIAAGSQNLCKFYSCDLETDELTAELYHFKRHKKPDHSTIQEMYSEMLESCVATIFPNINIVFRLFLTLMVSNASGERTFSKLKRLQNFSRNTISEEKLNALALLCIESQLVDELDFSGVIQQFAANKARKRSM